MPDVDLLRTVGDQLVPPPLDSLVQIARRRDRRSAAAAALAAGAAVAGITTGVLLLTPGDGSHEPQPAETPTQSAPTARPLTYADGSIIRYGDQTVDADGRVDELDLTDQGVAYRTADGRIWFSDGDTTEEIGNLGEPVEPAGELDAWAMQSDFAGVRSTGWIVSGNSGSLLSWFDFTGPGSPHVVVYDTAARDVVLRTGVDIPQGSWAAPHSVTQNAAYLFRNPDPVADDEMPQVRLDFTSGAQTPISPEEYLAETHGRSARSLLISHAEQGFELDEIIEGPGRQFDVHRGRLRPMGMQPIEVRDGLTGDRLELRAPDGYPDTNPVWLVQWLDDDSMVIFDPVGDQDQLLVCPVPKGTCQIAVTGPSSMVVPDAWWR
jgi:hypothetical protein